MYKIIKNGEVIALTDKLNFIKRSSTGVYVSCTKEEAQGVAVKNVPYNIYGRDPMDGCETVIVIEVDGGEVLTNAEKQQTALAALLVDVKYKQTLLDLGVSENA